MGKVIQRYTAPQSPSLGVTRESRWRQLSPVPPLEVTSKQTAVEQQASDTAQGTLTDPTEAGGAETGETARATPSGGRRHLHPGATGTSAQLETQPPVAATPHQLHQQQGL